MQARLGHVASGRIRQSLRRLLEEDGVGGRKEGVGREGKEGEGEGEGEDESRAVDVESHKSGQEGATGLKKVQSSRRIPVFSPILISFKATVHAEGSEPKLCGRINGFHLLDCASWYLGERKAVWDNLGISNMGGDCTIYCSCFLSVNRRNLWLSRNLMAQVMQTRKCY